MALGALSLLGGVTSHSALTDIYHGNSDMSLEWSVLRVCALIFLVFVGSALFTLGRALKVLSSAVGLTKSIKRTATPLIRSKSGGSSDAPFTPYLASRWRSLISAIIHRHCRPK